MKIVFQKWGELPKLSIMMLGDQLGREHHKSRILLNGRSLCTLRRKQDYSLIDLETGRNPTVYVCKDVLHFQINDTAGSSVEFATRLSKKLRGLGFCLTENDIREAIVLRRKTLCDEVK